MVIKLKIKRSIHADPNLFRSKSESYKMYLEQAKSEKQFLNEINFMKDTMINNYTNIYRNSSSYCSNDSSITSITSNRKNRKFMSDSYDSKDMTTISKVLKSETTPVIPYNCDFSNDSTKKLFKNCDFSNDSTKKLFKNCDFSVDSKKKLFKNCDFSVDSKKKLFKNCDFSVDIPEDLFVLKRKKVIYPGPKNISKKNSIVPKLMGTDTKKSISLE
jgi:hypothetical protein